MNTSVVYNDYKKYCTDLGVFREVVETATNEDGTEVRKTKCFYNIQDCIRSFIKQSKKGYSTMGSHVVKKHIDVLREMLGSCSGGKRKLGLVRIRIRVRVRVNPN